MTEPTKPDVKIGDRYRDPYGTMRVIAIAEGWSMVRRKGAMPFVLPNNLLINSCEKLEPAKRKPR